MSTSKKPRRSVRRSIALPPETDVQVKKLAQAQRQSANRILQELVEAGLAAKEAERRRFFDLADRLRASDKDSEIRQIKQELARMTFGS